MSNIYKFRANNPRQMNGADIDVASAWMVKIDRGLTGEEDAELQKWLHANSGHCDALYMAAELWDDMESLTRLSEIFPPQVPNKPVYGYRYSAAAILVVVSVFFSAWLFVFQGDISEYTDQVLGDGATIYETSIGEKSTVILSDGSQLTLNTNSRVREQFSKNERGLILDRGELYINVSHDNNRPFNVYADGKVFQAVGTAFNVEIQSGQKIELIVTEGKVWVGVNNLKKQESEPAMNSKLWPNLRAAVNAPNALVLAAGERIVLTNSNEVVVKTVETVGADEINVNLSWRGGTLIFRGESLVDAIKEIERYTRVEFVILDDKLKKVRVAGMFKAGDVDGLLATLKENFNVHYKRVDDEKIVLLSFNN